MVYHYFIDYFAYHHLCEGILGGGILVLDIPPEEGIHIEVSSPK